MAITTKKRRGRKPKARPEGVMPAPERDDEAEALLAGKLCEQARSEDAMLTQEELDERAARNESKIEARGGVFDIARCPRCRHPLVARMSRREGGPAVMCPCSHPEEHWSQDVVQTPRPKPATQLAQKRRRQRW